MEHDGAEIEPGALLNEQIVVLSGDGDDAEEVEIPVARRKHAARPAELQTRFRAPPLIDAIQQPARETVPSADSAESRNASKSGSTSAPCT